MKGLRGSKDRKGLPVQADRQAHPDLKETKVFRGPLESPVRPVLRARREALVRQAPLVRKDRPALPAWRGCMR